MLRFKQYLREVAKPKSEVDKEVFANHPVKVTDNPTPESGENVVKTKKDTSRRADNQPGEDEVKYKQNNKPGQQASYHESEQLDEISKERALAYHDKAISDSQPLAAKKKKSEDQMRNRIRSGKPLSGFKPKDKLSGYEERKLKNREKWSTKVRNKHIYGESVQESEYETEDNKRKVKRIKHEKGEIKIMSGRAKEDES